MQASFDNSAVPVDPAQWASWLANISENPHHHGHLVQDKNRFNYLSDREIKNKSDVAILNFKKIANVTAVLLADKNVDVASKGAMLKGLSYIQQERAHKYQGMFSVFRWFAKLSGAEEKIREEKETVDLLKGAAERSLGVSLEQALRIDSLEKEYKQAFYKSLEKYESVNEAIFAYASHLHDLKSELPKGSPQYDEIAHVEKILYEMNPRLLRMQEIVDMFGGEALKPTLQETIEGIYQKETVGKNSDYEVSEKDVSDMHLFQCDEVEAKAMYIRRQAFFASLAKDKNEAIFAYASYLHDLKAIFPKESPQYSEISQVEKTLYGKNPRLPRIKEIVRMFGAEAVKPTLKETIEGIYEEVTSQHPENKVSAEDLTRDQNLFQCDEVEVKALYIKRLIKHARTDFSLSLIAGIETTWQKMINKGREEPKIKAIDAYSVLFIPGQDGGAYVLDREQGSGSYKTAVATSEFFQLKKKAQINEYVLIGPKEKLASFAKKSPQIEKSAQTEAKDSEVDSNASDSSQGSMIINLSQRGSNASDSSHGSVVMNPSQRNSTVIEEAKTTTEYPDSLNELVIERSKKEEEGTLKGSELELIETDNKSQEAIQSGPVSFDNAPEIAEKTAVSEGSEKIEDPDEAYKKEAELYLKFGKLPGIIPTYQVRTVEGMTVMIQKKGGFEIPGLTEKVREKGLFVPEGEEIVPVDLEEMGELLRANVLTAKEQMTLLNMLEGFLQGVQSVHNQGYLHRDIKPANVICVKDGTAGLSDFGLACELMSRDSEGNLIPNPELKRIAGTANYMSPEIANIHHVKAPEVGPEADIWSIGMSLWEILCKESHPAIMARSSMIIMSNLALLMTPGSRQRKNYEDNYPEPADKKGIAHLIWSCTRVDANQRPDLNEVIQRYREWQKDVESKLSQGEITSLMDVFEKPVPNSSVKASLVEERPINPVENA